MTEQDYLDEIWSLWPNDDDAPDERLLLLVNDAQAAFPESSELQAMCGDVYSLFEDAEAARSCYLRAIELDPTNAEALEELGDIYDIHDENPAAAEDCFRRAIAAGKETGEGSPFAYAGLARVLAERGDKESALQLLEPRNCPFAHDPTVAEMRREIAQGLWSQ